MDAKSRKNIKEKEMQSYKKLKLKYKTDKN